MQGRARIWGGLSWWASSPRNLSEDSGPSPTRRFVASGLDQLGLEADDAELAVIEVVDALYRPLVDSLLAAELDQVDPEPGGDLSRGPRSLEER